MKADAVAPNKREKWVADRVKQGIDVMICHPRLVQTGLDLIDFQTLCWYETEFSVFQSTQKGTVYMGSRFGCGWGRIGVKGLRGVSISALVSGRRSTMYQHAATPSCFGITTSMAMATPRRSSRPQRHPPLDAQGPGTNQNRRPVQKRE